MPRPARSGPALSRPGPPIAVIPEAQPHSATRRFWLGLHHPRSCLDPASLALTKCSPAGQVGEWYETGALGLFALQGNGEPQGW